MLQQTLEARPAKPFALNLHVSDPTRQKWLAMLTPALERMLGLHALNGLYGRCSKPGESDRFVERILGDLGVEFHVNDEDVARIPKTGPVVVVCNHPFGALDGLILTSILKRIRPDARFMANYLLGRIPELRDMFMLVDPFGGESSAKGNIGPLRQAIRWVHGGGMLAVFPAGEVAHAELNRLHVTESAWSPTIARIASKAGAPVLPIYFTGRNSMTFQVMGMAHPYVRTAMLPREVFSHRGQCIEVRVGSLITQRKLAALGSDAEVTEVLRQRTLMLEHRCDDHPHKHGRGQSLGRSMEEIIPAVAVEKMAADICGLPADQLLVDGGDLILYRAAADQVPSVMREIGRLREITYRATGEGTGRSIDLDRFDDWYQHLFIWNKTANHIVGAYRLARTDEIVAARGTAGLYTSTLFKYRPGFIERLGPAIELGRSFIRAEYQRSFAPLLVLWKGISKFVLARPDCKTLFGPVSITNDYRTVSKHVMIQFLEASHGANDLAELTQPRSPFRPAGLGRLKNEPGLDRLLGDGDIVDDLVADLEPDGKGLPVLIRQYLKLGARFFSFNVDADFGSAIDALMFVDLTQTDRKILQRYMGVEGCNAFHAYHGADRLRSSSAWRSMTQPALH